MSRSKKPKIVPVGDLKEGQVIKSHYFQYGYRDSDVVWIDGRTTEKRIEVRKYSNDERLALAAKTGNADPPTHEYEDLAAFDPERAKMTFVVTEVKTYIEQVEDDSADGQVRWLASGSSSGRCYREYDRLSWVDARVLNPDGSLGNRIRIHPEFKGKIEHLATKKVQVLYVD